MKLVRLLPRLALLSLAAAALVGLTGIYGRFVRPPLLSPSQQAERLHRPSAPHITEFSDVFGDGVVVAIYAVAGCLFFRLRLSPVPREEKPVFLDLGRGSRLK